MVLNHIYKTREVQSSLVIERVLQSTQDIYAMH